MRSTSASTAASCWCIALASVAISLGLAETASARSLEISPAGSITATSLEALGNLRFFVNETVIECRTTLDLEVDASADKREGVKFGEVRRAETEDCVTENDEEAEVTFLGLPWSMTYQAITGALPSEIGEVLFDLRDIQVLTRFGEAGGCGRRGDLTACLFRGDLHVWMPLSHILMEEPYVNQLMLIWETSVALNDDDLTEVSCPSTIAILGQFAWEPTQTIIDM